MPKKIKKGTRSATPCPKPHVHSSRHCFSNCIVRVPKPLISDDKVIILGGENEVGSWRIRVDEKTGNLFFDKLTSLGVWTSGPKFEITLL